MKYSEYFVQVALLSEKGDAVEAEHCFGIPIKKTCKNFRNFSLNALNINKLKTKGNQNERTHPSCYVVCGKKIS